MADLDGIVDRLQQHLGPAAGAPEPLEGGITNRNYRARFGAHEYVIRVPGKDTSLLGISRDSERIANETAAALGIAPAVAAAGDAFLVTSYLICAPIDADRLRADPAPVAAALRAFHQSRIELPTRFWVPELLEDYARIVRARGGSLSDVYRRTQALSHRIAAALPLSDPAPCHDDLLPANLLQVEGDGVMLVDWEYAGMGHPMFDLGNLSVNNEFDEAADERLLAAYFGELPTPGRRAALRLMRIMSDAREAAWGVVQGVISELDFDFGEYAANHFARLDQAASDPRLEDWLELAEV
jgi:thiamine kinase-like enzyme